MPKNKTKKSAAKRFKVTGSGKILRRKSGVSHLFTGKSANKKRGNKGMQAVDKTILPTVETLLGR